MRDNFEDLKRILVPTSDGNHIPIGQVAEIRHSIGPQELKSENGLLVGYVTLNTRDRDEVSVVEDAERPAARSKASTSDDLIAAGRHNEARSRCATGYYWEWSGQFENQREHRAAFVAGTLGPPRDVCHALSWVWPPVVAFIVFFGIMVSASGGMLMLDLWGVNLSVAVWIGFIALFGVADDDSVVMLTYLEQLFRKRTQRT